jgi:DNA-binding SARP family transcriptional activator/tetratricopeptide (TPR) repeat protein
MSQCERRPGARSSVAPGSTSSRCHPEDSTPESVLSTDVNTTHGSNAPAEGLPASRMEFRLLGAMEVETDGSLLPFRGAKQRALLAALLLHANEVVSREQLIEELWRGRAPTSAVHSLEAYISRLRRTLGGDGASIESHPGGYRLPVDPEQLDRFRFEQLVEEGWRALAAGDAHAADERLGEALALWRGRPLPELSGEPTAELEADRLEELRLSALEGQLDARLTLRRHSEIVGRLRLLVATYPLREGLQRLLMLALYRCGRQAEALDVYRQARRRLVEELGLEPGPELQWLQEAILRQDPALDLPAGESAPEAEAPPLLPPRADVRPRLERKLVTVLACDLGSMGQSETTDPEDVRTVLLARRRQAQAELEQFGGTVETFVGDTAVAVFGAPLAHENDPERAVRAALAIRDLATAEPGPHVRIGLATGEALVLLEADPAPGEETVSGLVVASAAQLQEAARPDGILADERTRRAVERVVESLPGPPVVGAGSSEPRKAWEIVRARSSVDAEPAVRIAAPLIGREQELAVLTTALERACEHREPQLVTIIGVPGIGKTRLIAELHAAVERSGRLLAWHEGHSLPYGDGASFWAFAEIVKSETGILDSDSPDKTARRLHEAATRLFPEPDEANWVASHLRRLAGLADDGRGGETRRGESFAAWRRFIEGLAGRGPVVLVFEDLQWADDGLLDFLDQLTERLSDVPALFLASARPELLARRPAWGGGKPNGTTLSLSPLSDEETGRLVHALLDGSPLPVPVLLRLIRRAGGNPLYTEELVRTATGRDSGELHLPDTVHASIAARLDTLRPEAKALLQDAAVIGEVFWPGALHALGADVSDLEGHLDELERLRFVRHDATSAFAGERQCAFRHVLIRDVAYATIPRAGRLERHRHAATWIESLGRPDDHADLLAHHYRSALELARETGALTAELQSATVTAVLRAGDRAFGLNAFPTAARWYDEALELGVGKEELGHVLFRLGVTLNLAFDERRVQVLERARETLLAAGDRAEAAETSTLLADIWWKLGRADRNRQELARAQELLEGAPVSPTGARVLAQAARYAWIWMQPEEALRLAHEAFAIAEQLDLDDVVVSTLNTIGSARIRLGDRTGGAADLERAIELGLRTHDPETATAYNNLAASLDTGEELQRGRELQLEAQRTAERFGNEPMVRFLTAVLLGYSYQAGEWAEALTAADAILAGGTAGPPDRFARGVAQRVRAHILLARDDEARAETAIRDALAQVRTGEGSTVLLLTLTDAAHVYHDLRRDAEARAAAEDLLPLIRPDYLFNTVRLALSLEPLGLAAVLRDALIASPDGAAHRVARAIIDREYLHAADLLAAGGSRTLEAEARFRAAGALGAAGRTNEAEEQLDQALAFYRSVGAVRYLRTGETLRSRLREEAPRSR